MSKPDHTLIMSHLLFSVSDLLMFLSGRVFKWACFTLTSCYLNDKDGFSDAFLKCACVLQVGAAATSAMLPILLTPVSVGSAAESFAERKKKKKKTHKCSERTIWAKTSKGTCQFGQHGLASNLDLHLERSHKSMVTLLSHLFHLDRQLQG